MKTFAQFMAESEEKKEDDYHPAASRFGKHSEDEKKKEDEDDKNDDDNDGDDDESGTDDISEEVLGTSLQDDSEVNEQHKKLSEHYSKFTDDHKKAIKSYTTSSQAMNNSLMSEHKGFDKHGDPHDVEDHKRHLPLIKKMDSMVKKHKTPEEMHVYTGLNYSPAQYKPSDHKEGAPIKITHPGYTSTSISKYQAEAFAAPSEHHANDSMSEHHHIMKIHVPKGHAGAYIDNHSKNKGEKEFVLPRNTKLSVHPTPEYGKDAHGQKLAIWHAKIDQ